MIPTAVKRVAMLSLFSILPLPTAVGQGQRESGFYTIGRKDLRGLKTSEQFKSRILEAAGKGPNFANSLAVVAWSGRTRRGTIRVASIRFVGTARTCPQIQRKVR